MLGALDFKDITLDINHGNMTAIIRYKIPYVMNGKFFLFFPLLWGLTFICVVDLAHPLFYQLVLLIWYPVNYYALRSITHFLLIWIHRLKAYPTKLLWITTHPSSLLLFSLIMLLIFLFYIALPHMMHQTPCVRVLFQIILLLKITFCRKGACLYYSYIFTE